MTDLSKLPVTVITGFLGSGKTTLVRHLMQNPGGKRLAVVVNEFGDVGGGRRDPEGLRHPRLPRREHHGTGQRLHLLHRGRRLHPHH